MSDYEASVRLRSVFPERTNIDVSVVDPKFRGIGTKLKHVMEALRSEGYDCGSRTYGVLLKLAAATKNPELVEYHLREMQQAGVEPQGVHYVFAMSAYASKGNPSKVKEYWMTLRRKGFGRDKQLHSGIFNALMKVYGKVGDEKTAFQIAKSFFEIEQIAVTSHSILSLYYACTSYEKMVKVLSLQRKHDIPLTPIMISLITTKCNTLEEANYFINFMPIPGLREDRSFWSALTALHVRENNHSGLLEIVKYMSDNNLLGSSTRASVIKGYQQRAELVPDETTACLELAEALFVSACLADLTGIMLPGYALLTFYASFGMIQKMESLRVRLRQDLFVTEGNRLLEILREGYRVAGDEETEVVCVELPKKLFDVKSTL